MTDASYYDPVGWSAQEISTLKDIVVTTAIETRIASEFLPAWRPQEGFNTEQLPVPLISTSFSEVRIENTEFKKVLSIESLVDLKGGQVKEAQDNDASSAAMAFRFATRGIAILEDAFIFLGINTSDDEHGSCPNIEVIISTSKKYKLKSDYLKPNYVKAFSGDPGYRGLLQHAPAANNVKIDHWDDEDQRAKHLVTGIARAIEKLARCGHSGSYSCVLGGEFFAAAQSPSDSMILPSDRIKELLLGGTIYKSSVLPPRSALLISTTGTPADLAVPRELDFEFLRVNDHSHRIFRMSERFLWRVSDASALSVIFVAD